MATLSCGNLAKVLNSFFKHFNVAFLSNTKCISLAMLLKHVSEFSKLTLSKALYSNIKRNKIQWWYYNYVNSNIRCYVSDILLIRVTRVFLNCENSQNLRVAKISGTVGRITA